MTKAATVRKVQASEAKTQFLRILDEVEQGQSVLVTRHGKAVAQIIPVAESEADKRARIYRAKQDILEIRKRTKPTSVEEILAARDEGRR